MSIITPLVTALATIVIFILAWVITSVPVWISAKIFSKNGSIGRAMIATLTGIIAIIIISGIFGLLRIELIGVLISILAVIAIYKAIFNVSWLGAIGIGIMSIIIEFIILILVGYIGLKIPVLGNII